MEVPLPQVRGRCKNGQVKNLCQRRVPGAITQLPQQVSWQLGAGASRNVPYRKISSQLPWAKQGDACFQRMTIPVIPHDGADTLRKDARYGRTC